MVQTIKCINCGNSRISFGNISVSLEFSKSELCCNKCSNITTNKQNLFFCSLDCFDIFMQGNCIDNRLNKIVKL